VDERLCKRLKCPNCRRVGLAYRPHTDGTRYRVVALCECCGHAEER
jgi:hypothetical protein